MYSSNNSVNLLSIAFLLLSLSIFPTRCLDPYEIELDIPEDMQGEVARYGDVIEFEDVDPELSELYFQIILRRNIIGIKGSESQAELCDGCKINSEFRLRSQNYMTQISSNTQKIHEDNHVKYFIKARTLGNKFLFIYRIYECIKKSRNKYRNKQGFIKMYSKSIP